MNFLFLVVADFAGIEQIDLLGAHSFDMLDVKVLSFFKLEKLAFGSD